MSTPTEEFREVQKDLGLTCAQMAAELDCHESTVKKIRSGSRQIPPRCLGAYQDLVARSGHNGAEVEGIAGPNVSEPIYVKGREAVIDAQFSALAGNADPAPEVDADVEPEVEADPAPNDDDSAPEVDADPAPEVDADQAAAQSEDPADDIEEPAKPPRSVAAQFDASDVEVEVERRKATSPEEVIERLAAYAEEPDADIRSGWKNVYLDEFYRLDVDVEEVLIKWVKGQTEIPLDALRKALAEAARVRQSNAGTEDEPPPDPATIHAEAEEHCKHLINCPDLLKAALEKVAGMGVIGEEEIVKGVFLAALSPHLGLSNVVSVVVRGESASGKSYATMRALELIPPHGKFQIASSSERALFYMSTYELSGKVFVVNEANRLTQEDSEFVGALRTLITEGSLSYPTVEKGEDGVMATVTKHLEGPTALVTTTTKQWLDNEVETRLLSVNSDDSEAQTRRILVAQAKGTVGTPIPDLSDWHHFYDWLRTGNTSIVRGKWAVVLAKQVDTAPQRIRRDFARVLALAMIHAYLHQGTRPRDKAGAVVATLQDYEATRGIMEATMSKGTGYSTPPRVKVIVNYIEKRLKDRRAEGLVRLAAAERDAAEKSEMDRIGALFAQGIFHTPPLGTVADTVRSIAADLGWARQTCSRTIHIAIDRGHLNNEAEYKRKKMEISMGRTPMSDDAALPSAKSLLEKFGDAVRD